MPKPNMRSPGAKVGNLSYFGRMLDKIRLHEKGKLPADYQPNLGKGFDESCVQFLCVDYHAIVERVRQGLGDEQLLESCFQSGTARSPNEIHVWNEYMRKRGWNDEITPTLERRKREAGMAHRSEIQTMFQFIDADEGRPTQP